MSHLRLQIIDTRPINAAINDFVVAKGAANPDFSNLPVSTSADRCWTS
jgi:hypothetical protein